MSQATKSRVALIRLFSDGRAMLVFAMVVSLTGLLSWRAGFGAGFLIVVGSLVLCGKVWQVVAERFDDLLIAHAACAVGDWVRIGDQEGEVLAILTRGMTIRTRCGDALTVSYSQLAAPHMANLSRAKPAHMEAVRFQAPAAIAPNRIRALLIEAANGLNGVVENPPASCRIAGMGGESIDYEVTLAVRSIECIPNVRSELAARVWYSMARAGMPIGAGGPMTGTPDFREALSVLDMTPLFAEVPENLKEEIARTSASVLWGAGECIVEEGMAGDSCYVVRSGELGVYVSGASVEKQVASLCAGDIFGEMSLLTGETRAATVRALKDSELLHVRSETLKRVLRRSTDLVDVLARTVALRRDDLAEARLALSDEEEERVRTATSALSSQIRTFYDIPENSLTANEGFE